MKKKCKMCGKVHESIGKFCPACLRIKRLVNKIPKKQRQKVKRFVKTQGVSIRRLLA